MAKPPWSVGGGGSAAERAAQASTHQWRWTRGAIVRQLLTRSGERGSFNKLIQVMCLYFLGLFRMRFEFFASFSRVVGVCQAP